jgi:tetratricopeptide (TPR) repeat protein
MYKTNFKNEPDRWIRKTQIQKLIYNPQSTIQNPKWYKKLFVLTFLATLGLAVSSIEASIACNKSESESSNQEVQLFDNLGNYHHPISTQNPLAQRYFDQGLTLAYGFNHAEAARLFQQAAKLDPNCAMCYWGIALVLGPNINASMAAEALPQAREALQKALELSDPAGISPMRVRASDKEKAYIQALAKRYPVEAVEDRSSYDRAYASAMRDLVKRYPDDLDAATLFAEALMDTTPWDYWDESGNLKPEGAEIVAILESVIARNPNHPGANHLYIHAVEKKRPELAVASADRLMKLVPDSGHLVHMASHIYIRVGRYQDAVIANQRGVEADNAYVASRKDVSGIYPLGYMPHNHHFLWFAALMSGQSKLALEAARHTAMVDEKLLRDPELAGSLQHYSVIPLYTLARFARWDEILATPAPAADLHYPMGVWHYVRGMAFTAKGQLEEAAKELEQLKSIAADPSLAEIKIWGFNSTASILEIATEVLTGNLAAERENYAEAIAHLEKAVNLEESLVYTEPADWYQPTRQILAAVLLKADRSAEAERVFREDLKIYPDNGWSLYGLAESLRSQGKEKEAQTILGQFKTAWQYADVTLEKQ